MINRLYIFLVATVIILFDQFSKYGISRELLIGEKVSLISNVLSFTKAYNTGAAFSLLQDKTPLLVFFSIFVSLIIIIYFIKQKETLPLSLVMGWGLILGGTIGNMIDRIRFGYVIDFIKLDFINFPIFNLADFSINVGAFLILVYLLLKSPCPLCDRKKENT